MLSLCLPFCLQQQAGIAEGKNIYIHAIFTFQPAFYIMYQTNWATCHQFASLVCVTGTPMATHMGMPRMKAGRWVGVGFLAGGSLKAPEPFLGQFTDP